jgi:hypothetical protein
MNIKKRILSFVLVFVLLAGMLPTSVSANNGIPNILTAEPIVAGSGIDYSAPQIIIYGSAPGFEINLSTEKLFIPDGSVINGFSINDGQTWTAVGTKNPLSDANFGKLLNNRNGVHLRLTTEVLGRNKKPPENARIISFAKINPRPTTPKVAANYEIFADLTGATPGAWTVVSREKGADVGATLNDVLEVAPADATGKAVDRLGFGNFLSDNGVPVHPINVDARGNLKVTRHTYFVRVSPASDSETFTPASRPVRFRVTSERKPTRYRANYRNETIGLKRGDVMYAGAFDDMAMGVHLTDAAENTASISKGEALRATNTRRTNVSISNHLSPNSETVIIRSSGSTKRAATAAQVSRLAPRATLEQYTIMGNKGKISFDRNYQILNTNKNKWGNLPKINASTSMGIRTRATAKGARDGFDRGLAASAVGGVDILHGVWDNANPNRPKSGIVQATIIPVDAVPPTIIGVELIENGTHAAVFEAEISSGPGALLVVSVLEDTQSDLSIKDRKVVSHGNIEIEELVEADKLHVLLSSFNASHFIIEVRLLDRNGLDLTPPFYCIKNTVAYEDFLETTYTDLVGEFGAERVIDMGYGDDTALMATAEEAIIINAGDGGQNELATLIGADGEVLSYTFYNIDSGLSEVKIGDKLVITNGDELYVIDVNSITPSNPIVGSTVTITSSDEFDLTDFFDFINISMVTYIDDGFGGDIVGFSAITPATTLWGRNGNVSRVVSGENGSIELNAGVNVSVYLITEARFSTKWKGILPVGINLYVKLGIGANASFTADAKATTASPNNSAMTLQLFDLPVSLGAGFTGRLNVTLVVDWSAFAEGNMTASAFAEAGVVYDGTARTYTRHGASFNYNFDGRAVISVGTRITTTLSWLGQVSASIWALPKVEVQAAAFANTVRPMIGNSHHMCNSCVSAVGWFVLDAGFNAKYNIGVAKVRFSGTIVEQTYRDLIRQRLFEIYISLANSQHSVHGGNIKAGNGQCPNIGWRATVTPLAVGGSGTNNAAQIIIECRDTERNFGSWGGPGFAFLYPGDYTVWAEEPEGRRTTRYENVDFTIAGAPQEIPLAAIQIFDQEPLRILGVPNVVTYGDGDIMIETEGGSGTGAVTFTLVHNPDDAVSLNGNTVKIENAGKATIQAVKAGDGNHHPGRLVEMEINVKRAVLIARVIAVKVDEYELEVDEDSGGEYVMKGSAPRFPRASEIQIRFDGFVKSDTASSVVTGGPPEARVEVDKDNAEEAWIYIDTGHNNARNYEIVGRTALITNRTPQRNTKISATTLSGENVPVIWVAEKEMFEISRTWGDSPFTISIIDSESTSDVEVFTVLSPSIDSNFSVSDRRVTINSAETQQELQIRVRKEGDEDFAPWVRNLGIIVHRRDISDAVITLDTSSGFRYNGERHTPAVTSVTIDGEPLTMGVDVATLVPTEDYTNNINAGTATVSIKGIGNYTGMRNANFTIGRTDGGTVERIDASRPNTFTIPSLSFGHRSITAPALTSTTGQAVEYAVNTNSTPPNSGWTTNRTFSNLTNQTYYVFARAQAGGNYNAGPERELRVPHTGWVFTVRENVPDNGNGDMVYSLTLIDGSTHQIHKWNRRNVGPGVFTFTMSLNNIAPWVISSFTASWEADGRSSVFASRRTLIIDPIEFWLDGHETRVFYRSGYFSESNNELSSRTRSRTYGIW